MPPPTLQVSLDQVAQAELERRYHTTRDAQTRTRYQMVLLNTQGHTHPRSPGWSGPAPTPSAGCSSATWPKGRTRSRTGPTPASRPTTHPAGSRSWSGSPTWTPRGWGGQCAVDVSAAGRLPGRGDRPCCGDRDGADRAAPGRVCGQAAPLDPLTQGARPAGVGKKRLRVEALLAAAASPLPPPAACLVPDATLAADLFPEDLPRLLGLLEHADLYLQDEVEVALHPTLTRVWSHAGRSGQRLVQAPGKNYKQSGFGLVDWRDGWLDFELAGGRRAVPFCDQLRRAVARSRARGRIAMVILD